MWPRRRGCRSRARRLSRCRPRTRSRFGCSTRPALHPLENSSAVRPCTAAFTRVYDNGVHLD
jgi:hypothetical protein